MIPKTAGSRPITHPRSDPFPLEKLLATTLPLSLADFARPAVELAKNLLSCVLLHNETAGMIVETEAYLGLDDLAAHASKGKTERTKVLFGPPGHAYVYLIYGMYECLNVVADHEGSPGCVLIRALEPLCGLEAMSARRHWTGPSTGLTNGPGKLTRALAIDRRHYGMPLDKGELTIRRWCERQVFDIAVTPRIGIKECADWPLRFLWDKNPNVSKPSTRS